MQITDLKTFSGCLYRTNNKNTLPVEDCVDTGDEHERQSYASHNVCSSQIRMI